MFIMDKKKRASAFDGSTARRILPPLMLAAALVVTGLIIVPAVLDAYAPSAPALLELTPVMPEQTPGMPEQTPEPTPEPTPDVSADQTQTPLPTPAAQTPELTYSQLAFGTESEDVTRLQTALMSLGYMDADEPGSLFNDATKAAVTRFQRANYMTETGVADTLFQDILYSGNAKEYLLEEGNEGLDVSSLQARLIELGYFEGYDNGYYGAATMRAVTAFQAKNNIDVTGTADGNTLELLYSPAAKPKIDPTPSPTPKPTPKRTPKPTATPKPASTGGSSTQKPTTAPTAAPSYTDTPQMENGSVSDFIAVLKEQLGKPYIYSTEGPSSFDCSGLVYYCLRSVGVSTSRYSASGFSKVDRWLTVSYSELQPGDLIFFYREGTDKIGHVGVWLGGGKYLHASTSSGAVVTSSWSSWAERTFSHGKRVFG